MTPHDRYLAEVHPWLRQWWQALQPQTAAEQEKVPHTLGDLGRGDRAKLQRCTTVDELAQESAANLLAAHLAEGFAHRENWKSRWVEEHYEALFLVAGILSHVKKNPPNQDPLVGRSLAWVVGNANIPHGRDRASMSELRFKRLLKSRNDNDFYRQLIHTLRLAGGVADVSVLADDVLAWSMERDRPDLTPSNSLKFRWARDYYVTAKEPVSSKATKQAKNKESIP
jgi:CRISPR system Cascade subunit CasB